MYTLGGFRVKEEKIVYFLGCTKNVNECFDVQGTKMVIVGFPICWHLREKNILTFHIWLKKSLIFLFSGRKISINIRFREFKVAKRTILAIFPILPYKKKLKIRKTVF